MKVILEMPFFVDLPFDGDKRLISGQRIYVVNNDIVSRLTPPFDN